jgi:hypothetical protein
MRKFLITAAFILAAVFFTGCIEVSTLINVNRDGSGTVEETVMLSREIIDMITDLEKAFAEDTADVKPFQFYNEDELKSQSSGFGDEVVYISSRKISRENREGYHVMYEFRDINKLQINQNPNSRVKLESFDDEPEVQEEFITFSFIKEDIPEVRIQMPVEKKLSDSLSKPEISVESDTTMINEQLTKLFQDLRITMELNVQGKIKKTNAEYVQGSKVTLLDINFGELLTNSDKLREFRETDPQNFEQVKSILRGIPGIKVELSDMVFIQFE